MEISKREAANRQLNEAILMLFEGRDIVAVHTLVGAANIVISDLIKHHCPDVSWDKKAQERNNLIPKEFYRIMRKTQNFLKHASNDPDGILNFDETEVLAQIIHATMNNCELGGMLSREQSFYQLWYLAVFYKELEWDPEDVPNSIEMFGDLSEASNSARLKKGRDVWNEKNAS